jgi:hypothetical protein
MILNNKSERLNKEAIAGYFMMLYHHLHGVNEENHENFSPGSQPPGSDSNPGLPKCELDLSDGICVLTLLTTFKPVVLIS